MSFLQVSIPIGTLTSLVEDVRKQVNAGRLKPTSFGSDIERRTPELNQLISVLTLKLKRNYTRSSLLWVTFSEPCDLDKLEGEKCVFCIRTSEPVTAWWTDMVRKICMGRNDVLICEEGCLRTGMGEGGIYLILYDNVDKLQTPTTLREQSKQQNERHSVTRQARHTTIDRAIKIEEARGIITLEECQKQLAFWEKLSKEIMKKRKRELDSPAQPEIDCCCDADAMVDEGEEHTTLSMQDDYQLQLALLEDRNRKRLKRE
ncbi:hypothetical protein F4819DRAFT_478443 [Hypoxylon fuscum]|nr:hypothetical protein F4819DRAFT_478443 [Hypoxylon fuscum]